MCRGYSGALFLKINLDFLNISINFLICYLDLILTNCHFVNFTSFISLAQENLSQPLPGHDAHLKLMHKERILTKIAPNENTKSSAVLMVFYPDKSKVFMPLILRPKYDGTHGGQMAFPGGKMEHFDRNLTITALREAQEEIGIKAMDVKIIGELTEVFIPVSNFKVQPIVGYLEYKPEFFPDQKEVSKIFEMHIEDFFESQNIGWKNVKIGQNDIEVPGFAIQEQWIWGATALIINEFLEVISKK
jgi:8-oxo-dGTP pyrophosphatase MutT (NUDIX family)